MDGCGVGEEWAAGFDTVTGRHWVGAFAFCADWMEIAGEVKRHWEPVAVRRVLLRRVLLRLWCFLPAFGPSREDELGTGAASPATP